MRLQLKIIKRVEDGEDTEKKPTYSEQSVYEAEYTINAGKMNIVLPIDSIESENKTCKLTGIALTLEAEVIKKPIYHDDDEEIPSQPHWVVRNLWI
jgi:hypothetical protein